MELHLKDRLLMSSLLPEKVTLADYVRKKAIIKKLEITNEDVEFYNIQRKGERIEWDIEKDAEKPLVVEFTAEEKDFIQRVCESRAEEELPSEVWELAEKIYSV